MFLNVVMILINVYKVLMQMTHVMLENLVLTTLIMVLILVITMLDEMNLSIAIIMLCVIKNGLKMNGVIHIVM